MIIRSLFLTLFNLLACLPLAAEEKSDVAVDFSAGLEIGYKDSVLVEELDLVTTLGDHFTRYKLKAEIEFAPDKNNEFAFSIGLTDRQYQDATDFDLQTLLATASYNYDFGDLKLGIDFRSADSELGGTDFLTLKHTEPYFTYFISRNHFLRGSYTTVDTELDNNQDRNSDADEYSLSYYYFINGLNHYVILGGKWREQDAEDDIYDFVSDVYRFSYIKRFEVFEQKFKFSTTYRYRERDYDSAVNPAISDFRFDEQDMINIVLSLEISDGLEIYTDFRYLDNTSNLPDYTFSENRYTAGISYDF